MDIDAATVLLLNSTISQANQIDFFGLPWWINIIIGAIIAVIFEHFVVELLPSNVKQRGRYFQKWVHKMLHSEKIDVLLILKTPDISQKSLEVPAVIEALHNGYRNEGYNPAKREESLMFDVPIGKHIINVEIFVGSTEIDDKLIVDQIESHLKQKCSYRHFDRDVHELREAQLKIQKVMREKVSDIIDEISLRCELNSVYELTGVLARNEIGSLQSSTQKGKLRFELFKNVITAYGTDLNTELLSLMRQMITIYY